MPPPATVASDASSSNATPPASSAARSPPSPTTGPCHAATSKPKDSTPTTQPLAVAYVPAATTRRQHDTSQVAGLLTTHRQPESDPSG